MTLKKNDKISGMKVRLMVNCYEGPVKNVIIKTYWEGEIKINQLGYILLFSRLYFSEYGFTKDSQRLHIRLEDFFKENEKHEL